MRETLEVAERDLLGAMMRDAGVIGDVLAIVRPEHFRTDALQKVFRALVWLWNERKGTDAVAVADRLKQLGQIEDVGGYVALAELWNEAATGASAVYHADIVRNHGIRRRLHFEALEIAQNAKDGTAPADELLDQAQSKLSTLQETGTTGRALQLQEMLAEYTEVLDGRLVNRGCAASGLPTGFLDLDERTAGLQDRDLVIVGARPSVGKTVFGWALVCHAAIERKLPALFISLEQSYRELTERLISNKAGVNSHKLRLGTLSPEEIDRVTEAIDRMRSAPIFVDDTPGQTVLRIAAVARRLHRQQGIRLLVVDYLGLVECEGEGRRTTRNEQIAGITKQFKRLARELGIPVVALSQLNRGVEDRGGRPRLADLRDSGAVEQDADMVLLLHRSEADPDGVLEVDVAKQRNGPTGIVKLAFERKYLRLSNLAQGIPEWAS